MEKSTDPLIHDRSNVVSLNEVRKQRRSSHSSEDQISVKEKTVDVLLCSLCGSQSFLLIADQAGEIGCAECGFLIGARWTTQGFIKVEE